MLTRKLGPIDHDASLIGFGAIPIMADSPMGSISESDAIDLMQAAFDRGVNYLDTAISYGDSEIRVGKALKGGYRERVFLATKTYIKGGDDSPAQFAADIDSSLQRLGVDVIDCYQIHYIDRNGEWAYRDGGIIDVMKQAQQQGKIRYLGVTGHTPEPLIEAVKTGEFALALLPYSLLNRANEPELLPLCAEMNVATVVMKPIGGGSLATPREVLGEFSGPHITAGVALRFVLSNPHVTIACPGMDSMEELDENLAVIAEEEIAPLTEAERTVIDAQLARITKETCRQCGYCMAVCPQEMRISDILRYERYAEVFDLVQYAQEQYRALVVTPEDCLTCGECEKKCPYGLGIRARLQEAMGVLRG